MLLIYSLPLLPTSTEVAGGFIASFMGRFYILPFCSYTASAESWADWIPTLL